MAFRFWMMTTMMVLPIRTIATSSPASFRPNSSHGRRTENLSDRGQVNSSPTSQKENLPVFGAEPETAQLWMGARRRLMDCSVYLLLDSSIVDMSREGDNTQSEVQSLFPSTTLWTTVEEMQVALTEGLPRKSLVIVPEQERGSLVSALGSESVAMLQQHVQQEEAHLMVLGSNRFWVNHDVEVINAVSGSWSVAHAGSGIECESESGRVVHRDLGGAGFDAGPASLPYASAVYCMDESTLPENVDGLYADSGECYAWTAGMGNGRITHIGADFFTTKAAWTQLIGSSADAVCGKVRVSTSTTVSTHSSVSTQSSTSYTTVSSSTTKSSTSTSYTTASSESTHTSTSTTVSTHSSVSTQSSTSYTTVSSDTTESSTSTSYTTVSSESTHTSTSTTVSTHSSVSTQSSTSYTTVSSDTTESSTSTSYTTVSPESTHTSTSTTLSTYSSVSTQTSTSYTTVSSDTTESSTSTSYTTVSSESTHTSTSTSVSTKSNQSTQSSTSYTTVSSVTTQSSTSTSYTTASSESTRTSTLTTGTTLTTQSSGTTVSTESTKTEADVECLHDTISCPVPCCHDFVVQHAVHLDDCIHRATPHRSSFLINKTRCGFQRELTDQQVLDSATLIAVVQGAPGLVLYPIESITCTCASNREADATVGVAPTTQEPGPEILRNETFEAWVDFFTNDSFMERASSPRPKQERYFFQTFTNMPRDAIELVRVVAAPDNDINSQKGAVLYDKSDCNEGLPGLDFNIYYTDEDAKTTLRVSTVSFGFMNASNTYFFFTVRRCDAGEATCGLCGGEALRRMQAAGLTPIDSAAVFVVKATGTEKVLLDEQEGVLIVLPSVSDDELLPSPDDVSQGLRSESADDEDDVTRIVTPASPDDVLGDQGFSQDGDVTNVASSSTGNFCQFIVLVAMLRTYML